MAAPFNPRRNRLSAIPRLMQIIGAPERHKFGGTLFGRRRWPKP